MGEITRNHNYTVDMNKPLTRQSNSLLLASGDNNGDCIIVTLMRGNAALVLDEAATVSAYFIQQDGNTVTIGGSCESNRVSVTLPQSCYDKKGNFSLAVKVVLDGAMVTVAVVDGFIK